MPLSLMIAQNGLSPALFDHYAAGEFRARTACWQNMTGDIDEGKLKSAEEAFRESEYELRQIIDTVPGFLWSVEPRSLTRL
jgi:hypothetical protein